MRLENTWQEIRDFIQNLSRSFRFTAPWRCLKHYYLKCIIKKVNFWGKINKVMWQKYICSCLILWLDLTWPLYEDSTWLAWGEPLTWLDLLDLFVLWLETCLRLDGRDLRLAWDLNMCDLPPPLFCAGPLQLGTPTKTSYLFMPWGKAYHSN